MNVTKDHLIVFSKNPIEGEVKTRLAKSIGSSKALLIHNALAQKTARVITQVQVHKSLYYSKKRENHPAWENACQTIEVQKGKDLGERMFHALHDSFQKGFKKTILIGTDLWDLNPSDIQTAFEKLDNNDIVIGPALDGGYYLIGMNALQPKLFKGIMWGGDQVLKDTLKKCEGIKTALLHQKNDIDLWEDLMTIEALKKLI